MNIDKEKRLPKRFTINPELNGKYDNEPYFQKKVEKVNQILRKTDLPDIVKERLENSVVMTKNNG